MLRPTRRGLAAIPPLLLMLVLLHSTTLPVRAAGIPMFAETDSTSTFDLSSVSYAVPGDTVQIDLTLSTTRSVNYLTNTFVWDHNQLVLVGIDPGPALTAISGSFTVADPSVIGNALADTVSYSWDNGLEPGVSIDPAEAIVELRFEVQCYGYSATASIGYAAGEGNYFNDGGGTSRAPLRNNGSVQTVQDLVLFQASSPTALPLQDFDVAVQFFSFTPATPTVVDLVYDSSRLEFVTAALDPVFTTGSISTAGSTPGVVHLQFLGTNAPHWGLLSDVAAVTFRSVDSADDYTTPIDFGPATTSINVCNDGPANPTFTGGTVTVPRRTATMSLGNSSAYTTASFYDVPFTFDSTFDVNGFVSRIETNPPLTFYQLIDKTLSQLPTADPQVPGEPLVIHVSPTTDVVYAQQDLPAQVFTLRFRAPVPAPAAGTTFTVSFADTTISLANQVNYLISDPPPTFSAATGSDLTFQNATIHILNPPGNPTCPTLYVWNGKEFSRENTLLSACAAEALPSSVTDYYRITQPVGRGDGQARFVIREDDVAITHFDSIELWAVDHPLHAPIRVTEDGNVVQLGSPYTVQWAKDDQGRDITNLVRNSDQVAYVSTTDGWIDVGFGEVPYLGPQSLLAATSARKPKEPPVGFTKSANSAEGSLEVLVRSADGSWTPTGISHPRYVPGREAVLVNVENLATGGELVLRYRWKGYYRVDNIELENATPIDRAPLRLAPSTFTHSVVGSVLDPLGKAVGGVVLSPGEELGLSFDLKSLDEVEEGMTRDYVLVSTGRYGSPDESKPQTPAPSFALRAASPNPFNPATTIHFSLPQTTEAKLTIFDLRGARVRTLIDGVLPAGEQFVVWDGRSDRGVPVASGIYLYKLTTPTLEQTRKMTLLK